MTKGIKMGIASIRTTAEVRDVYLGIDTTGRRRYGTPVLNMASRVAKSAATGQILMVGGVRAKDARRGVRQEAPDDQGHGECRGRTRRSDLGSRLPQGQGLWRDAVPLVRAEVRRGRGWCLAGSGFQGDT